MCVCHGRYKALSCSYPRIRFFRLSYLAYNRSFSSDSLKYGLVELKSRFNDVELPEIIPVDVREMRKKNRMRGNFTPELLNRMQIALDGDRKSTRLNSSH